MIYTLFIAAIIACQAAAQPLTQSAPFELVVLSTNSKINGSTLFACHKGAEIEGFCLGNKYSPLNTTDKYSLYRFNTSVYDNTTGLLIWNFPSSSSSEPMGLIYNPLSNVAVPTIAPFYSGTYVGFDKYNKLNIQGYLDDRVNPSQGTVSKAYYRWHICETYYSSYVYTALAWAMGEYPPENPTCVKVEVIRIFV